MATDVPGTLFMFRRAASRMPTGPVQVAAILWRSLRFRCLLIFYNLRWIAYGVPAALLSRCICMMRPCMNNSIDDKVEPLRSVNIGVDRWRVR